MIRKLLVVYASRHGQTEKVARSIANVARDAGIAAEVAALRDAPALADFTDVIVAGSVYFGRHSRRLVRFVRRHRTALEERHTAFVTVCGDGEILGPTYVRNFLRDTAWAPSVTATFAGAIPFTRYGWLLRLIMRPVAAKRGIEDTTRDYEFTDWDAVETFAREFVGEEQARAGRAGLSSVLRPPSSVFSPHCPEPIITKPAQ